MSTQLRNNPMKVALASMVGTAIEFFDYYIYAAAAVLVFNTQFFHSDDPLSNDLLSLSTLALAFFARPIGSALFDLFGGHTQYIVFSFFIKGIAGLIVGGMTAGYLPPSINKPTASFSRILVALIIGAIWTAFGYFIAWWFVLNSAAVAASKIQYSLITSAAGIIVAIVLTPKLKKLIIRA